MIRIVAVIAALICAAPAIAQQLPAGLDKQLSTQELADLITYLRSSR